VFLLALPWLENPEPIAGIQETSDNQKSYCKKANHFRPIAPHAYKFQCFVQSRLHRRPLAAENRVQSGAKFSEQESFLEKMKKSPSSLLLQGCTLRCAPGSMYMRRKNCILLPAAGRRTKLFTSYSRNPERTIKCIPVHMAGFKRGLCGFGVCHVLFSFDTGNFWRNKMGNDKLPTSGPLPSPGLYYHNRRRSFDLLQLQ